MRHRISRELQRLDIRIAHLLEKECSIGDASDITGTNGQLISFLLEHEDDPVYQKDIEKAFGITRSTASRVLVLMEEKGLVKRMGVDHDARLKKLILTEKSQKMGQRMRQIGEETDEKLLEGFAEDEKEQLFSFIDRMMENISKA